MVIRIDRTYGDFRGKFMEETSFFEVSKILNKEILNLEDLVKDDILPEGMTVIQAALSSLEADTQLSTPGNLGKVLNLIEEYYDPNNYRENDHRGSIPVAMRLQVCDHNKKYESIVVLGNFSIFLMENGKTFDKEIRNFTIEDCNLGCGLFFKSEMKSFLKDILRPLEKNGGFERYLLKQLEVEISKDHYCMGFRINKDFDHLFELLIGDKTTGEIVSKTEVLSIERLKKYIERFNGTGEQIAKSLKY